MLDLLQGLQTENLGEASPCEAELSPALLRRASFIISVVRNNKYKTGLSVKPKFQLALHNKDTGLLLQIPKYFGVGKIFKNGVDSDQFR